MTVLLILIASALCRPVPVTHHSAAGQPGLAEQAASAAEDRLRADRVRSVEERVVQRNVARAESRVYALHIEPDPTTDLNLASNPLLWDALARSGRVTRGDTVVTPSAGSVIRRMECDKLGEISSEVMYAHTSIVPVVPRGGEPAQPEP